VSATRHSCETWSREQLEDHQLQSLRRQLTRLADRFNGIEAGDLRTLEDLQELPLSSKADYQRAIAAEPPYGDLLSVPPESLVRLHFSSGTTGRPAPTGWTADDLERWTELYARFAFSQGVRSTDVHQCLFSYAWFVGGLGATAAYARLGATVIPAGSADTERQIDTIERYGTTSIGGTPSFLLHIADAAEQLGVDLHNSSVRHVMVGGEPGGALPATRAAIEQRFGARCYDGYGCLEFQPIGWECEAQAGPHLCEDFLYAETLDPATKRPVPAGQPGVLVLTHLDKQAFPLVRWWTGDVVVLDRSRCQCGRTHTRLPGGVRGRADDMLVIRGVNVFPAAVEELVRRQPGVGGEYRIVVERGGTDATAGQTTGLHLQVEARADAPDDLGQRLTRTLQTELKVKPTVEILALGTLPRDNQKAKRVAYA